MASIKHVLNPKNNERIRNIDRKGQQIVLTENVLFKVTTACAASFVIPPKANRRKRHITLRTMKTGTFLNTLKPYFLSVTDGGTFFNQFSKTICTIIKHNELLHQAEYMKFSDVTCRVSDNAMEPACKNLLV